MLTALQHKRRRGHGFHRLLSLLLCATFCSPALALETHPLTGEKLAAEQVFTYNMGAEPPSIDPQLIEDVSGNIVALDLFEGLLTQNTEGGLAPGVAKSWEKDANGKVYTFHLRDNALWSNGEPVTADDFVYAWRRSVDPALASPQAGYLGLMTVTNADAIHKGKMSPDQLGVSAPDKFTFKVELEQPLSYFAKMLTAGTLMPVPRKIVEKYGDKWTRPGNMVSNGAYRLEQHVINERLVRVRNPFYWNNDNTIIDKVVALMISESSQSYKRYQADELDHSDIPPGQYRRLKKERPNEIHSDPRLCSYFYSFNVTRPPTDDRRVRQALHLAIDRDIITNHVLGSGQIPAYTLTPGATAGFNPSAVGIAAMEQSERDQLARELLSQAGYDMNHPLEFTLLYNTSEGHKKIAIAISQMWKEKLGAIATLENQEWKTFLTTRDLGEFQVSRIGWCGYYNEASSFLTLLESDSEYNDSRFNDARYDALMKQARTLSDPRHLYLEAEAIIAREAPVTPIYHYTTVIALKPWVRGWPFRNIQNYWYSKNLYIVEH